MQAKDSRQAGSGLLFFWQDKVLLIQRSPLVAHPFTWGVPGGMMELVEIDDPTNISDDAKLKAAMRECREELGSVPQFAVFDQVVYRSGPFQFTTFFAHLPPNTNWRIHLNWEHVQFKWFLRNQLPSRLHPGVKFLVNQKPQYFQ